MERTRKRSWSDHTWQLETVNITSGSRFQARIEDTAADVVLFQEHRRTAPRLLEQRSRIHKKGWDVTLSPALQCERFESALKRRHWHCIPRGRMFAACTLAWSGLRSTA